MSDTLLDDTDAEWGGFIVSRHCGPERKDGKDRRIILKDAQGIIVGFGEVGSALHAVLSERRSFSVHDPPKGFNSDVAEPEWMHIAFPYTKDFISGVTTVVTRFQPENVVIHSTVPVGATRQVEKALDYAADVYYSPVRGRHPTLAGALRRFPKYYASSIAGELDARFESYFAQAGIQTRKAPNYEVLEYAKLMETTTFGIVLTTWMEMEKQIAKFHGDKHANLNVLKNFLFEKRNVYDGDLGLFPVLDLVPGPLQGHCVSQNYELLREQMTPELYAWLTKSNEMRK